MTTYRTSGYIARAALVCSLALGLKPVLADPPATAKVREPAVAGLFYPKDKSQLERLIDACLASAKAEPFDGELKALVCPHAGYVYSGPVAAYAYKLLAGHEYETVMVLAPSHYASLRSASVSRADYFRTPLGDVPVDTTKAVALARLSPFAPESPDFVQRPDWWRQASCPAPEPGDDTAHTWEHSAEVQVPFLQKTLQKFNLLPIVFGSVDPEQAARTLVQVLDDHTLIIASSDLSHYDSYANAQKRDRRCVDAICALRADQISTNDACGAIPVQTLMLVAKAKGWKARLLDYRNSGDTSGDKSHGVVGYAAIAFYAPTAASTSQATYTPEDRRFLLDLARKGVREAAATGQRPAVSTALLSPKFTEKKGCFVTLTENGKLRGCIGHIIAQEPLVDAILDNARNAALQDPRFNPVRSSEVDQLEIEVSVLTEPLVLPFSSPSDLLGKLHPGADGVVLQIGNHSSTYLPQVWEQLPDREAFLDSLAQKGGSAPSAWRGSGVKVFVYHVESFKEAEVGVR